MGYTFTLLQSNACEVFRRTPWCMLTVSPKCKFSSTVSYSKDSRQQQRLILGSTVKPRSTEFLMLLFVNNLKPMGLHKFIEPKAAQLADETVSNLLLNVAIMFISCQVNQFLSDLYLLLWISPLITLLLSSIKVD